MEENNEKIENKYWINKYKPKKIEEINGCIIQIKQITKWLNNFEINSIKNKKDKEDKKNKKNKKEEIKIEYNEDDEKEEIKIEYNEDDEKEEENIRRGRRGGDNENSCIIITGDHGIGKTSTVQCILREMGYNINTIKSNMILKMKKIKGNEEMRYTKKKIINDYINNIIRNENINDIIIGKEKRKNIILIDDLESIVTPIEKNVILQLIKRNENEWICPIIFITNNSHTKFINIIKTNSYEIKFWKPTKESMRKFLENICDLEKNMLENESLTYKIIKHSQNDYRRLIMILQDINELYNGYLTNEQFDEYIKLETTKNINYDIYNTTTTLIYNYNNIEETIKLYETDKVLIPLMIQQNYINIINKTNIKNVKKIRIAKEISEILMKGDIIENYIYGNHNWNLQNMHGLLSCTIPSYTMTNILKKEGMGYKYNELSFPLDLNRTSIKKINFTKNIVNSHKYFKRMEIDDFIYLNKIIKGLFITRNIEECNKLFNKYKCDISVIESVLKIDKIKGSKYIIPNDIKKKINCI